MRIFFSVGEPSGDLHGANLIRSLQAANKDVQCCGYGGPRMKTAGLDQHHDLTQLAVMWIGGALWNLRAFWGLYQQARRFFRDNSVDAVVLIDFPGFNWWIAKAAKEHGVPVFYYGAPQLWAWASWRVRKMKRLVDHVLCKLPFEAHWYRDHGCNAHYVGHPYFDELSERTLDADRLAKFQQPSDQPLICLLPGSRRLEVTNNLPSMLKAVAKIRRERPDARFAIASFNSRQAEFAKQLSEQSETTVEVFTDSTAELIEAADCCIAVSGSVSLELLYHRKPAVILYHVSPLMFWIAHNLLVKVRFMTLVNLLAAEQLPIGPRPRLYDPNDPNDRDVPFPEYPTCEDKSSQLAAHILEWLNDRERRAASVRRLEELKDRFVSTGASDTAASYIMKALRSAKPSESVRAA